MNYHRFAIFAVLSILVLTAATNRCGAASISIDVVNHSFEAPLVPRDGDPNTRSDGDDFVVASSQMPNGWSVGGPSPQTLGQLTLATDSFFSRFIALPPDSSEQTAWANEPDSYFYQTLSAQLEADMQYVLTVDLGNRTNAEFPDDVQIRLAFGGTPGTNFLTAESSLNPLPPNGEWVSWENTYVTDANPAGLGQPLRVELRTGGHQALLDNVRLDATPIPIPEPGTLLLLAIALVGLACRGGWGRGR